MVGKFRGVARYFDDLAERHREGVASGRTPAELRRPADRRRSSTAGWRRRSAARPDARRAGPARRRRRGPVARAAAGRRAEAGAALGRGATATCSATRSPPHARPDDRCGLTWLPDGDEVYARAARVLHDRRHLARGDPRDRPAPGGSLLEDEYAALGPEVVGTSDVPDRVRDALRDDPALHHTSGDEIVADSKTAMARARAAMGDWFGRLPQADCDVEGTTSGAIAYYFAPPKDGSRGGVFFMNVSDPEGWGRFEIENTSYHEGIPGHHLQLAIAAELDGTPGVPQADVHRGVRRGLGALHRAARRRDGALLHAAGPDGHAVRRLDAGLPARRRHRHARPRAGAASGRSTTCSPTPRCGVGHVTAEIDRYAVTPGQALSYMIGRLEIQRIRRAAEQRQGDAFDIRAFHDAVLDSGPAAARPARPGRHRPPPVTGLAGVDLDQRAVVGVAVADQPSHASSGRAGPRSPSSGTGARARTRRRRCSAPPRLPPAARHHPRGRARRWRPGRAEERALTNTR